MTTPSAGPAVIAADREVLDRARQWADRFDLPLATADAAPPGLNLWVTARQVELRDHDDPTTNPLAAAPHALDTRSGPGRSMKTPLARAVGLAHADSPPRIADATGGLGEDSWLLAAAGCEIITFERHPVVAMLLADGLQRAATVAPEVAGRIALQFADATTALGGLAPPPSVILIDPMFPPRKKSAREKKAMRWLRRLVGPDPDAAALLAVARTTATDRVIVKRPRHADPLADDPVAEHAGRGYRWDVYRPA
ncbi:MAG: class I SAM-dependent methyltransferase [Phycisphaeraceae bacterium]|nr:class I SAM-dependent methyltransferase [Phycisphaeraceae bacterium]